MVFARKERDRARAFCRSLRLVRSQLRHALPARSEFRKKGRFRASGSQGQINGQILQKFLPQSRDV